MMWVELSCSLFFPPVFFGECTPLINPSSDDTNVFVSLTICSVSFPFLFLLFPLHIRKLIYICRNILHRDARNCMRCKRCGKESDVWLHSSLSHSEMPFYHSRLYATSLNFALLNGILKILRIFPTKRIKSKFYSYDLLGSWLVFEDVLSLHHHHYQKMGFLRSLNHFYFSGFLYNKGSKCSLIPCFGNRLICPIDQGEYLRSCRKMCRFSTFLLL